MQLLPIGNTKVLNYDHFMIFLLAEKLSKKWTVGREAKLRGQMLNF